MPVDSPTALLARFATITEVLCHRAETSGDDVAYAAGEASLTYRGVLEEAGRLGGCLATAGVRAGDRIAIVLPAGLDFMRVFWAIQWVGAIPCALNPQVPSATALRRAARVRPSLVVYDAANHPSIADATSLRAIDVGSLSRLGGSASRWNGSRDDLAFLQPTSGTSGEPRIAMLRQRNVLDVLAMTAVAANMTYDDILVAWVPPWHDLGLVRFAIGAVCINGTCHIVPPAIQTIPLWLETIARTRATITGAPDFAWRLAARLGDPSLDLSSLRYAINGGEPVRSSTVRSFENRYGLENVVMPGYGLAEATLTVSFSPIGEPVATDARGNVSCGPPTPGVEVRIDETGEILVGGPGVFAGYLDAPEATAEMLRDGWLHTGDEGYLDDGGRLYVLGRRRAMIKRGGAVLSPRELEEAAQNAASVRIAAAFGSSSPQGTEEIVVVLESDASDSAAVVESVSREVMREIGFAPDRILLVASRSIPRTWNGKIRHAALRDEFTSGRLEAAGLVLFDSKKDRPSAV